MVENPWSETTKTSVWSRSLRRSNSARTSASLRSELSSPAKDLGEPGALGCWEKSGSLNHNNENAGTPFDHSGPVKARVVHSSRFSFGNGDLVSSASGNFPSKSLRDGCKDDGST